MQNDPFCMESHVALIASSILQPNAHYAVYLLGIILYPISPTFYGVLYSILRENFLSLLKTVRFIKGCYITVLLVITYTIFRQTMFFTKTKNSI
jgi:hypothetical protein